MKKKNDSSTEDLCDDSKFVYHFIPLILKENLSGAATKEEGREEPEYYLLTGTYQLYILPVLRIYLMIIFGD